ncbi:DNA polymerase III subunit psi [Seminibacterium arietis]|uniref:DNA polymerase III subunit psi n=2 Tax=Seminibacterium arietis TaxID=1173502 RepID=A0ABW3I628_9PAST
MDRRDLLLQQMGITQWQLYRPNVFKGAINIPVKDHIRLIIISEQVIDKNNGLLRDILQAANVSLKDCLCIDFNSVVYLNIQHKVGYWLLTENEEKYDRTLPYCVHKTTFWHSEDWEKLRVNPKIKCQLWQQIQEC